jgi:hypothetical protein
MIHLHTSKIFDDDLTKSDCDLPQAENKNVGWHWYAHRITLLRKKCIIVMEENSRYALIYAGLKKKDFAQFDKILFRRIVAEASWLCSLSHPDQKEQLIAAVEQKCSSTVWSLGLNHSVQAHIRRVADEVEYLADHRLEELTKSVQGQFALGFEVNKKYRKCKGDKDYFVPYKIWRDSLLALLPPQEKTNVVNLADFRKGRGIV